MKKISTLLALLVMSISLVACTGLSKKETQEVEKTLNEYRSKLVNITWHDELHPTSAFRFFDDGRVEEIDYSTVFLRGVSTVEDGWVLKYSDEYDGYDINKTDKKRIEKYFNYYIHFKSPYRIDEHIYHIPIHFDEEGNLYMWDSKYVKGLDYIEEIPTDASLDSYFTQTVWGYEYEPGKSSRYLIFFKDGSGAETTGTYQGQLIYPTFFYWGYKDGLLYIDWYVTEDSNIDIDAYVIEKGDLNFQMTHYWDTSKTYHMIPSGDIDIANFN